MGEIIHFDFKNKKKEEPAEEKIKETKPNERSSDFKYLMKFIEFSLLGNAKELMHLSVSPSSLNQSLETVKKYTTEELINWLEETNENEWKKKATFFQAVFTELRSRLNAK